jgi:TP901 family phage tail tape measure protein
VANSARDEIIRYIFDAVGGEKIDAIKDSIKKAGEESQNSGTLFGFLEDHLGKIAVLAAAVEAALKTIEFGKESLKNAEDVEASLSRVKALAGEAADTFGEMDAAVEKAAQAVNVTSQTSASGLAALVSQGISAKDALDALIPTLQLAKIANIDVATAAQTVAESLKAFNIPASDAQQVVDQLTSASHGAAGGLGAMSNAAVQLAPDAKTLNLAFTDIVSILGLLNSKGLDTEKSVRGLRTVFQELENPTSSLRGQLLALGDGTNDFGAAIAALTSGTPRANEALLTLNGPARSLVETLGQAGPDAIAKFNAHLQETRGIAQSTASVLDDNLRGAATKFENAIDLIGEKLAKPVLTPFKEELEKLAKELNDFADSPDFEEISKEIGSIIKDGVQGLDKALHDLDWNSFLSNAKSTLTEVGDSLKAVADSAGTIATVVGKTADGVGAAYHLLGTTVDAVVAGIAKGADSLLTLDEKVLGLADHSGELHSALQSVGDEAGAQAEGNFKKLGSNLEGIAGTAKAAAEGTREEGAAHAAAAPQVEQHAAAIDKYVEAEQRIAAAERDATVELPTMVVRFGQAGAAASGFAAELDAASKTSATFKDKSGGVIDGTDAIKTAMERLHLASQQSLQQTAKDFATFFATVDQGSANTAAGLADRQNAFLAYAKAALAASAQADEGTRQSIQAQLDQKASVLGVTDALAELEKQSDSSQAALVSDANRASAALDKELQTANRLAGSVKEVASASDTAAASTDSFSQRGQEGIGGLVQAMAALRGSFSTISDAAAKAFDKRLLQDFNAEFDATGIGFTKYARALTDAAAQTNTEIANERAQLAGMIENINTLGDVSSRNFGGFGRDAATAAARMGDLSTAIAQGNYDAGLLGQQELQPLQAALDAARAKVQALAQDALDAKAKLVDMAKSVHDALLQAQGDERALEDERHQQQLADLQAEAQRAGDLNDKNYQQAVQDENTLHNLKLKNLEDQQKQQPAPGAAPPLPPPRPGSSGPGGASISPAASSGGSASIPYGVPVTLNNGGRTINIVIQGGTSGSASDNADLFESWLAAMARAKGNSI